MGFLLLGTLAVTMTALLIFRRAVEERAIRWEMYRLRDELRLLAFQDVRIKSSAVFRRLDASITGHCGDLTEVSIWSLLPIFVFDHDGRIKADETQRQLAPDLKKYSAVNDLYEQSVRLMVHHLLWRHMFLTALAAISLIGIVGLWLCAKWASERIVSGALTPVVQVRNGRAAHVGA